MAESLLDSIPGVWTFWETGTFPITFSSSDIIQHLHVGQWGPGSDWDPSWLWSSQSRGTRVEMAVGVSSYTILFFVVVFVLFKYHSENNKLLKAW